MSEMIDDNNYNAVSIEPWNPEQVGIDVSIYMPYLLYLVTIINNRFFFAIVDCHL